MNNISVAKETIAITAARQYTLNGRCIRLICNDPTGVKVITPEMGTEILGRDMQKYHITGKSVISVTTEDSFSAAGRYSGKVLVMNFANAHNHGGGFKLGANAQEEALCRCSTLYASISSEKARDMYRYNNTHISQVESDYMLLSDNVCVFRDNNLELLEEPFNVGVITAPAPNRRGAALFASGRKVSETFLRRIRIILRTAAENGYRSIVLGAWGCGAFGNSADTVSEHFRTALMDDELIRCFENVCFAVYGSKKSSNFKAFKDRFKDM